MCTDATPQTNDKTETQPAVSDKQQVVNQQVQQISEASSSAQKWTGTSNDANISNVPTDGKASLYQDSTLPKMPSEAANFGQELKDVGAMMGDAANLIGDLTKTYSESGNGQNLLKDGLQIAQSVTSLAADVVKQIGDSFGEVQPVSGTTQISAGDSSTTSGVPTSQNPPEAAPTNSGSGNAVASPPESGSPNIATPPSEGSSETTTAPPEAGSGNTSTPPESGSGNVTPPQTDAGSGSKAPPPEASSGSTTTPPTEAAPASNSDSTANGGSRDTQPSGSTGTVDGTPTTEPAIPTTPVATDPSTDGQVYLPPGATQTFDSNFANGGLDQFINGSDRGGNTYYPSNGELERYSANNSSVDSNGILHMSVTDNGNGTYGSDMIVTKDFAQNGGVFDMRAKLPQGGDSWPAFWTLSADGKPGEIDDLEALENGQNDSGDFKPSDGWVHVASHSPNGNDSGDNQGSWQQVKDANGNPIDLTNTYNDYEMVWNPGQSISYYVDGQKINEIDGSQTVPNDPMFILANNAVGGGWGGTADAAASVGGEMDIQYIKAWQFANQ